MIEGNKRKFGPVWLEYLRHRWNYFAGIDNRRVPLAAFMGNMDALKPAKARGGSALGLTTVLGAAVAAEGCGGGGDSAAPAVVPPKLSIIPPNSDTAIASDGAGLLPEEIDGSSTAVPLGKLNDDKNADGNAYYKLAEGDDAEGTDNVLFRIIDQDGAQILQFIGEDSGDFDRLATKKSFTLNIARYNNEEAANAEGGGNPQILEYVVNLADQAEVLAIINAAGEAVLSDGKPLLQENADGSTNRIELGKITDGTTASGVSYALAESSKTNFQIEFDAEDGFYKLYYTGSNAGDFENNHQLGVGINRIRNEVITNEFKYIINLNNVNDNDPVLAVEAGENLQFLYDLNEVVFGVPGDSIKLSLTDVPLASDSLIIKSEESQGETSLIIIYEDPTDTTSGIEQITIARKVIFGQATYIADLQAAFDDPANGLSAYAPIIGSPPGNTDIWGFIGTQTIKASTAPTLKVASGTDGIIADFSGTDADNLQALTYSVSDETNFQINSDGELRFAEGANAPTYDSTTLANNIYKIIVTVSDGTNSDTYPIQIEVTAAASPSSTASEALPSAAEAVPNKEPQKWEPSPFDNIFDGDPFGPIGGDGGDGVL